MKANIIQDYLFGHDIEIVTIGDDVTYYVFANRTQKRNWEVLSFCSIEEIAEEYMDNRLDYKVSSQLFQRQEAFTSRMDYCLWFNRKISEASIVSCLI